MIILWYYYDIIMILPQFHDAVSYVFFLQWQRNVGMESGVWDYMKNVASGSNLVVWKNTWLCFRWNSIGITPQRHVPGLHGCLWVFCWLVLTQLLHWKDCWVQIHWFTRIWKVRFIFSCRRYELPWTRQTELLCRKPIKTRGDQWTTFCKRFCKIWKGFWSEDNTLFHRIVSNFVIQELEHTWATNWARNLSNELNILMILVYFGHGHGASNQLGNYGNYGN